MWHTNAGFVFECKGTGNQLGVKEEFSCAYRGTVASIKAVFGIDRRGIPNIPAYFDATYGMRSLNNIVTGNDIESGVRLFTRSNRAVYSMCDTMMCICRLVGKYDMHRQEWVSVEIELYTANNVVKLGSLIPEEVGAGSRKIGVCCSMLSSTRRIDCAVVPEETLKRYRDKVLACVTPYIGSKEKYLAGRLGYNI